MAVLWVSTCRRHLDSTQQHTLCLGFHPHSYCTCEQPSSRCNGMQTRYQPPWIAKAKSTNPASIKCIPMHAQHSVCYPPFHCTPTPAQDPTWPDPQCYVPAQHSQKWPPAARKFAVSKSYCILVHVRQQWRVLQRLAGQQARAHACLGAAVWQAHAAPTGGPGQRAAAMHPGRQRTKTAKRHAPPAHAITITHCPHLIKYDDGAGGV